MTMFPEKWLSNASDDVVQVLGTVCFSSISNHDDDGENGEAACLLQIITERNDENEGMDERVCWKAD